MATIERLERYFQETDDVSLHDRRVGAEIETFFVQHSGEAITLKQSQGIFAQLVMRGWTIAAQKGAMITEITLGHHRIQYELGYPNIELAVSPQSRHTIIRRTRKLLQEVYAAAASVGAVPLFEPMYNGSGGYLAVPDERDATWLRLDGKDALSPLACISAVQFTVDVSPEDSIRILGRLLEARPQFLENYPQDRVWRKYVETSKARYRPDRFGGPEHFSSLREYCELLGRYTCISGSKQIDFESASLETDESIALFLRSVWWYFRLRKYGRQLCIEIRPLPRRSDDLLESQFAAVAELVF